MKYRDVFREEAASAAVPANQAGSGEVHGIGVGEKGEPGIQPRRQKKHKSVLRRAAPGGR